MNRLALSVVAAIGAVLFALAAPAFAGCNGCVQQFQSVYAQPIVQPLAVYSQPIVLQSYAQPVIQRQFIKQHAVVAPVQKQVVVERVRVERQPLIQRQRQVIRTRNVQSIRSH